MSSVSHAKLTVMLLWVVAIQILSYPKGFIVFLQQSDCLLK